jgi:hypothetical protein
MVVPAVRNPSGQPDPINAEVRDRLQTMVDALAGTRPETPAER